MGLQGQRPNRQPAPPGDIVCGLVSFRDERRVFEIQSAGHGKYEIGADDTLTHRQLTDWVWQLQAKNWVSGQHFADFFRCLNEFIYRQWGAWPQDFYEVQGVVRDQGLDEV